MIHCKIKFHPSIQSPFSTTVTQSSVAVGAGAFPNYLGEPAHDRTHLRAFVFSKIWFNIHFETLEEVVDIEHLDKYEVSTVSKTSHSLEKWNDPKTTFTFSAAKDSIWCLTEFLALTVTHVTRPGELAQLPKPAVLADTASTWTVTVTWRCRAEGPSFKDTKYDANTSKNFSTRGKRYM